MKQEDGVKAFIAPLSKLEALKTTGSAHGSNNAPLPNTNKVSIYNDALITPCFLLWLFFVMHSLISGGERSVFTPTYLSSNICICEYF